MSSDGEAGRPFSEYVEFFGAKTTMISTWSRWVRLGDWFTTRLVPPVTVVPDWPKPLVKAHLAQQRVRRAVDHWLFHGPECEGE